MAQHDAFDVGSLTVSVSAFAAVVSIASPVLNPSARASVELFIPHEYVPSPVVKLSAAPTAANEPIPVMSSIASCAFAAPRFVISAMIFQTPGVASEAHPEAGAPVSRNVVPPNVRENRGSAWRLTEFSSSTFATSRSVRFVPIAPASIVNSPFSRSVVAMELTTCVVVSLRQCARADIPVKAGTVERIASAEGPDVAEPYREFSMAVAKPLLGVGFKETPPAGDALKTEIICDMLTELICGSMTPLYRRLYDEGLVSPGFSGEILSLPGALSFLFGGETPEPETVRGLLLDEIARLKREGVDEELFTLCKNQLYGELVQDLENIEDVAGALASSFFRGRTPADEIETLASVTLSDVNGALRAMLCTERSATVIIRPAQ